MQHLIVIISLQVDGLSKVTGSPCLADLVGAESPVYHNVDLSCICD